MNSRERLKVTLNHQQPDRVPLDLGATSQTGISASTLYKLRKAMALEEKAIKVLEPGQILGEVEQDVYKKIGVDVIGLWSPYTFIGYKNENWKPWEMPDGTPTLMSGNFQYDVDKNGDTYVYPQGDRSARPSMKMPAGGYFFDSIDRSWEYDENNLNPKKDFAEDFNVFDDETAKYIEKESKRLYEETEYGIVGMCGGGAFGDVALIPGPHVKNPTGIRRMEDWLMAHLLYPDYIHEIFEMQAEIALKNFEIYKQAVGERIQVVWVSGTDFGTQNGEFMSVDSYRQFYKPYQKRLNDWIHKNTNWKTFYHTCGSIVRLLDDMSEAGIDILNPVQCSAAGMDPKMLKEKYGDKFVFWGGGVDTQYVLPFGSPEEVRNQVRERLEIFAPGGGFVFSAIHNIVGKTPVENIVEMYDVLKEYNEKK